MNDHAPIQPPPTANTQSPEMKWPAWMAIFTAPIFPAKTAQRTNHISLLRAWFVHILGILVLLAALVLVAFINQWLTKDTVQTEFGTHPGIVTPGGGAIPTANKFAMILLFWACVFALIESLFVIAAYLLTIWAGGLDRFGQAFRSALKRCWLQTTLLAVFCFLIASTSAAINASENAFYVKNPYLFDEPPPPSPPVNAQVHSKEFQEFIHKNRAYKERQQQYQNELYNNMPWYVSGIRTIKIWVFTVGVAWFVWGFHRAATVTRTSQAEPLEPLCQHCSYNLTGTDPNGACPECGHSMTTAADSHSRTGLPWDHRQSIGRVRAFAKTLFLSFRPVEMGKRLRVCESDTNHRSYLMIGFLLFAGIGTYFIYSYMPHFVRWWFPWGARGSFAGIAARGVLFAFTGLLLTIVTAAFMSSLPLGQTRSLRAAAIRTACYYNIFLPLMFLLMIFVIKSAPDIAEYFVYPHGATYSSINMWIQRVVIFVPIGLSVIWYLLANYRCVKAAKFANR